MVYFPGFPSRGWSPSKNELAQDRLVPRFLPAFWTLAIRGRNSWFLHRGGCWNPAAGEAETTWVYWRSRLQPGTAGGASRSTKVPEGLMASPSGGPKESHQLSWDKTSLSFPVGPRLAPTGSRYGLVTARAAAPYSRRGRRTNATARNRNVSGYFAAGRRPNANGGGGFKRRSGNSTPRPNASVVVVSVRRRRPTWT